MFKGLVKVAVLVGSLGLCSINGSVVLAEDEIYEAIDTSEAEPLKCDVSSITLGKGEKWKISVSGGIGKYKFTGKKVSVNRSGQVSANKIGSGEVTVTSGDESITIKVNVKNSPTYIRFKNKNVVIKKGKKAKVSYYLNKNSASYANTWTSSNSKVVKVNKGVLTGVKKGNAVITVRTFNGKFDTVNVTVE